MEVYWRILDVESYPKPRNLLARLSSLPSIHGTEHSGIWAKTFYQANKNHTSCKLLIAMNTFNSLVTSSTCIDINTQPGCGHNTHHFMLKVTAENSRILLDKKSFDEALRIADKPEAKNIDPYYEIGQLRQIRTKFDALLTYSASRASLLFRYRLWLWK
ncbi:hypothetical protein F4703DRAFT_1781837 [Phycomyces blakesleeanus]|uniref:Uncharacterized protein n=2 Tax=Phycomyces blakesleeanus TaxID=4837 RepID=A0A163AAK8_PHYB8|nr:hypothetical protein PHYBLDRAFT_71236 [Phycomyces blakesleeanus NRRL 1555(-)]OAD72171.1 hypothetical protein PHYBLDRAFT_71236 [Phycomyces blakesleeanus NRRL 1555(-)]|eukprot:XP_018290211.1 hypothetical protein PHYBLDRAFT_71236 [Phycomyces blakesleeanus NRRL 1555(-)]